jgi:hypothetical protein
MQSVICTLFEGNYHHGVAALVNSLYQNGFRGTVYAGYRGSLPAWVGSKTGAEDYAEVALGREVFLRFLPLAAKGHLTNYKPDFMLNLWDAHAPDADALFYFDPDIIVHCPWRFFDEWAQAGVAVCADVNSQMSPTHPLRHAWARYYATYGFEIVQSQHCYFSGGFLGVSRENRGFLVAWKLLQELMAPAIGGLENVNVRDRSFLFHKTDQDALNVATMMCPQPISSVGQDGMGFQSGGGGYLMTHAAGVVKPWKKKMLWTVLSKASRPSKADRTFMRYATFPLRSYSAVRLRLKKADLLVASALGRYLG